MGDNSGPRQVVPLTPTRVHISSGVSQLVNSPTRAANVLADRWFEVCTRSSGGAVCRPSASLLSRVESKPERERPRCRARWVAPRALRLGSFTFRLACRWSADDRTAFSRRSWSADWSGKVPHLRPLAITYSIMELCSARSRPRRCAPTAEYRRLRALTAPARSSALAVTWWPGRVAGLAANPPARWTCQELTR